MYYISFQERCQTRALDKTSKMTSFNVLTPKMPVYDTFSLPVTEIFCFRKGPTGQWSYPGRTASSWRPADPTWTCFATAAAWTTRLTTTSTSWRRSTTMPTTAATASNLSTLPGCRRDERSWIYRSGSKILRRWPIRSRRPSPERVDKWDVSCCCSVAEHTSRNPEVMGSFNFFTEYALKQVYYRDLTRMDAKLSSLKRNTETDICRIGKNINFFWHGTLRLR